MPAVLQVVHGYPPREVAGTEIAAKRLVDGLVRRGWKVHVLCATIAPARPQYSLIEEPGITRIVNNLPWRTLESVESDRCIDLIFQKILSRERPDLVHVHHLSMLSSTLRLPLPSVGTFHDHWAWCPAGGTLLRSGIPCEGPNPAICPACHAAWRRPVGRAGQAILDIAGRLPPWLPPDHLHQLWRHLPSALRNRFQARGPGHVESGACFLERQKALHDFWGGLDLRMAPSQYMASKANEAGLGSVVVIPHGMPPSPPLAARESSEKAPFVYLGSILPHKGVHIVIEAYRLAFGSAGPGLFIYGNSASDADYSRRLNWPLAGPLQPAQVIPCLARARALVMGSIWPENAPLVIQESRAAGCPVVAPAIGGIPEGMQDGRDGYLYAPGSIEDLARCLRRVVDGPRLSVEAPPSFDSHLDAVEAVYEQALQGRRKHG